MDIVETIRAVSENLQTLFDDKGELKGFHDWDALIGCVIALDKAATELESRFAAEQIEQEGVEDITDG